jgi:hypothetical protein
MFLIIGYENKTKIIKPKKPDFKKDLQLCACNVSRRNRIASGKKPQIAMKQFTKKQRPLIAKAEANFL